MAWLSSKWVDFWLSTETWQVNELIRQFLESGDVRDREDLLMGSNVTHYQFGQISNMACLPALSKTRHRSQR